MQYEIVSVPVGTLGSVQVKVYVPERSAEIDPKAKRPAAVIFPGGGYRFRSDREDEPIALAFLARGMNAFVAEYHVAPERFPRPQQDAGAAVAWVRRNAEKYATDPGKIAVVGFSAGGHLAGSLGVMGSRTEVWQEIGLTYEAVRPDALVLSYPVITAGPHAHRGSFVQLTGSEDLTVHAPLSLEKLVTDDTPPVFIWHTADDDCVPVQNTLLFTAALAAHKVPFESHIWPHGVHGLALASAQTARPDAPELIVPEAQAWPDLAVRFLDRQFGGNE